MYTGRKNNIYGLDFAFISPEHIYHHMPVKYSFVSRWKTPAPITDVWAVVHDSLCWPQWWPDFTSVHEITPGNSRGVGSIRRYTIRSPFGYALQFNLHVDDVKEYHMIQGRASGDLEGAGRWLLRDDGGATIIECHWDVCTTRPWMNMLAFILRPIFIYNHRKVMEHGAEHLSEKLGYSVSLLE